MAQQTRGPGPKIQQMPPDPQLLENAAKTQPWTCCQNCGGETFMMASRFKLLKALQVGGSEDIVVGSNCWACVTCGKINLTLPVMQPGGPR